MLPHHKGISGGVLSAESTKLIIMPLWWRRGESNPRPLNPTLASLNYAPRADKRVIKSCFVALARVGTDTPTVA